MKSRWAKRLEKRSLANNEAQYSRQAHDLISSELKTLKVDVHNAWQRWFTRSTADQAARKVSVEVKKLLESAPKPLTRLLRPENKGICEHFDLRDAIAGMLIRNATRQRELEKVFARHIDRLLNDLVQLHEKLLKFMLPEVDKIPDLNFILGRQQLLLEELHAGVRGIQKILESPSRKKDRLSNMLTVSFGEAADSAMVLLLQNLQESDEGRSDAGRMEFLSDEQNIMNVWAHISNQVQIALLGDNKKVPGMTKSFTELVRKQLVAKTEVLKKGRSFLGYVFTEERRTLQQLKTAAQLALKQAPEPIAAEVPADNPDTDVSAARMVSMQEDRTMCRQLQSSVSEALDAVRSCINVFDKNRPSAVAIGLQMVQPQLRRKKCELFIRIGDHPATGTGPDLRTFIHGSRINGVEVLGVQGYPRLLESFPVIEHGSNREPISALHLRQTLQQLPMDNGGGNAAGDTSGAQRLRAILASHGLREDFSNDQMQGLKDPACHNHGGNLKYATLFLALARTMSYVQLRERPILPNEMVNMHKPTSVREPFATRRNEDLLPLACKLFAACLADLAGSGSAEAGEGVVECINPDILDGIHRAYNISDNLGLVDMIWQGEVPVMPELTVLLSRLLPINVLVHIFGHLMMRIQSRC